MKSLRILVCAVATLNLMACTAPPEFQQNDVDQSFVPGSTTDFTFESDGLELSGIFDLPAKGDVNAIVLIVHGYGKTNVREWNAYADLRQRFADIGIATAVWDKPGQGQSEGVFDINQSVFSSAQEVLDAARYLRAIGAPGADKMGIWGVSRAGWIAPIAISKDPSLSFWISVSGTTAEDNFAYLLLSNLLHMGGTEEQVAVLADEWRAGCEIFRTDGSYDAYLEATQNLRANTYIRNMRGEWQTRLQFVAQQLNCSAGSCKNTDDDMCSYVFIEDFDTMLSSLDIDMLAIFGEKDLNVDWQKTRSLYTSTIGQNPDATLFIASFPDADHNLNVSETGSIREMQAMTNPQKTEGYYDVQIKWLKEHVLPPSADQSID